jgi:SAM-dependent methyltransferase
MKFQFNYKYKDRESKAYFVWNKYKDILEGKILDVGADKCYIKKYLCKRNTSYTGIGLGKDIDININLEKEKIPFDNDSFDCVLCLDVLEHLDNLHDVFDEICRVSKKYIIISLPNPYGALWSYLKKPSTYNQNQNIKFYGLPPEKPEDRHKWFFSTTEAKRFIEYKCKKNDLTVIQMDIEGGHLPKIVGFRKIIFEHFLGKYLNLLDNRDLYTGTMWVVLEKKRVIK